MANNTWKNYTQKSTALSDNDEVMLLDSTDEKNKRGLMSKFWDYVVDKMSTAVISKLETENKTVIGALNYLNGKLFMEIPVAITIENKTLNAKLSISDTDYGLICLTYQISAIVYAIALIVYGSKYNSKILSFVSSNAKVDEAKWDSNSKTFICTINTTNTDVVNARAILIK
jgi:hypothetical protein|nr:MAG TPA: hypothetical protein [Caudoviricetes sp.]